MSGQQDLVAKLVAACGGLLDAYAPRADESAAKNGEESLHTAVQDARKAIAEAKGEGPEPVNARLLEAVRDANKWNEHDIRVFDDTSPDMPMLKARRAVLRAALDAAKKPAPDPYHCPACGSGEIEATSTPEADCDYCCQGVVCHDCGATWQEVFTLAYLDNLEPGTATAHVGEPTAEPS